MALTGCCLRSTITATAGGGGTISPAGDVAVYYDQSASFTVAADAGYVIADVLVDGVSVGAVGSYTFTEVTEDHSIAAVFTSQGPVPGDGGGVITFLVIGSW